MLEQNCSAVSPGNELGTTVYNIEHRREKALPALSICGKPVRQIAILNDLRFFKSQVIQIKPRQYGVPSNPYETVAT